MAIVIPSKHIYSLQHKKIKNNAIDKINVLAKTAVINDEIDVPVFVGEGNVGNDYTEKEFEQEAHKKATRTDSRAFAHLYHKIEYSALSLEIPRISSATEEIKSIITGSKTSDVSNELMDSVSVSLYGTIQTTPKKESVSLTYVLNNWVVRFGGAETDDSKEITTTEVQSYVFQKPSAVSVSESSPDGASVSIESGIDISDIPFSSQEENKDKSKKVISYTVTMYIPKKVTIMKLKGYISNPSNISSQTIYGEEEVFSLTNAELTVNGNKTTVSFEEKTVSFGAGTNELSVEGSEILHPIAAENYKTTLQKYKDGLETATLVCDLGEYYDEDGAKAKSVKEKGLPMVFKNGDIICITKQDGAGKEVPISKSKNGGAMLWYVVGTELTYDGDVLQKIFAQEYCNE